MSTMPSGLPRKQHCNTCHRPQNRRPKPKRKPAMPLPVLPFVLPIFSYPYMLLFDEAKVTTSARIPRRTAYPIIVQSASNHHAPCKAEGYTFESVKRPHENGGKAKNFAPTAPVFNIIAIIAFGEDRMRFGKIHLKIYFHLFLHSPFAIFANRTPATAGILHLHIKEAFLLCPLSEIRQNFPEGESSHKTPRLVAYPLPAREYRYSIKAWEWTVYFRKGVWRCLG